MPNTTTNGFRDENQVWNDQMTPNAVAEPLSPQMLKLKRIKKNGTKMKKG